MPTYNVKHNDLLETKVENISKPLIIISKWLIIKITYLKARVQEYDVWYMIMPHVIIICLLNKT